MTSHQPLPRNRTVLEESERELAVVSKCTEKGRPPRPPMFRVPTCAARGMAHGTARGMVLGVPFRSVP